MHRTYLTTLISLVSIIFLTFTAIKCTDNNDSLSSDCGLSKKFDDVILLEDWLDVSSSRDIMDVNECSYKFWTGTIEPVCIEKHVKAKFYALTYGLPLHEIKICGGLDFGFFGSQSLCLDSEVIYGDLDYKLNHGPLEVGLKAQFSEGEAGYMWSWIKISFQSFGTWEENDVYLKENLNFIEWDIEYWDTKE